VYQVTSFFLSGCTEIDTDSRDISIGSLDSE